MIQLTKLKTTIRKYVGTVRFQIRKTQKRGERENKRESVLQKIFNCSKQFYFSSNDNFLMIILNVL